MAPIGKHRQSMGIPRMKSTSDKIATGEKPATVLKLWIIRIQSGGVLVEGYKDVSENDATTLQNWRSTLIVHRLDAKTLQTGSGSVYKLKGGMDEEEAAEAGIPEELIEAFARGFPENWKELVEDRLKTLEVAKKRQSMEDSILKNAVLRFDDTMEVDEEERKRELKEAKGRRSIQKGRKSMLPARAATPIEEEEEVEVEETPVRKSGRTPARKAEERGEKTPGRGGGGKTPRGTKETPKGEKEIGKKTPRTATAAAAKRSEKKQVEEREEYMTAEEETPQTKKRRSVGGQKKEEKKEEVTTVAVVKSGGEKKRGGGVRRASMEEIPKEILDQSIPLTHWVIRFVRGGTNSSIFPHFQFKVCGFRPECLDQEWSTSAIQKVVPPYIMFTSSSIYRLDGPLDVDQSTDMGFPPAFITDFLMGFPDDWEERLETFFNKTFGPPPQPRIVELTSDCGAPDEKDSGQKAGTSKKCETPVAAQKRKLEGKGGEKEIAEHSASSSSSSSCESDGSDEEEREMMREARKVEKEMRREEERERRLAEERARRREEKKKRFEKKINMTPDGVPVSRSGRTLRTPLAKWAGENVTYDMHGNVVEMTGVTTATKLTIGREKRVEREKLAAHYGVDSPLGEGMQKERATAPPVAERPKTPAVKKSKAELGGYSDDETDRVMFEQYKELLKRKAEETPAFNKKPVKRRYGVVESSDPEAEEEEKKREKKRRKREEKRRLKESEEEGESSDDGWRRKRKTSKKKVVVKKEKSVPARSSKSTSKRGGRGKKREESEESESGEDVIEHDEDAVTFVPSDGSEGEGGGGYSDEGGIESEEESSKKKETKKRRKQWKKEELIRLKLAFQAADTKSCDVWDIVARSLGGERTPEECMKTAIERLGIKWTEPKENEEEEEESDSSIASGAASEDEEKKKRMKARMDDDDDDRLAGVTARKGTAAYAVQMEMAKRAHLMGGTASQDDAFKDAEKLPEEEALPSVAVFDPDDSLLELEDDLDAPTAPKGRNTKTAKAAAIATPRQGGSYLDDLSPFGSSRRSSARSKSNHMPSPAMNQMDLTRYVHGLSRNMSLMSHSMVNRSRMLPPKLPKGRVAAKAGEAIDRVQKAAHKKARGRENDLAEEDEESDDNDFLSRV